MSSQKKIVYLSSWYPNRHQPFVGNFVRRQAQLIARDHEVIVVHTVAHESEDGMRLETNQEGNLTEHIVYHGRGKTIFSKRRRQQDALKLALKKVHNRDLMITQILFPKLLQFSDVQWHFSAPWIHIEQGSYFRDEARSNWSRMNRWLLKRAQKAKISQFFSVSDFLRSDLQKVFPDTNIDLVNNHVDTERFCPDPEVKNDRINFLHVSTLDESTKNPMGMFEACKILHHEFKKDFHFTIVCDEETSKWEKVCSELKIDHLVTFKGPLKWEELPVEYQQADAFVLNSVYETFSIVLAEAWSTGTPTITTSVGIGHNLPDFLGIQTEIRNDRNLAEALLKFMETKSSFDSEKIRQHAEQFSLEKVRAHLNEIIEQHAR